MKARILVLALVIASIPAAAQQPGGEDRSALRTRITERFDVVPLDDGVALRPKTRIADVRLIEVTDVIAINGVAVSGQELREKLGRDAEHVLRLSYLDAAARRALFAGDEPIEARPGQPPVPPSGTQPPRLPDLSADEDRMSRNRRSHGDRVRIFGDVTVREEEEVSGQAVAVMGSAYINGTVHDQVVAVLGSVVLGPKAVVRGDVVSVGGSVRREGGAEVRGSVTEVALGDAGLRISGPDVDWFGGFGPFHYWFGPFGATSRLIGTVFRMGLLFLLAGIVVVLARRPVESTAARVSDNPAKSMVIGLTALILAGPILLMTCILLAITIIGIPVIIVLMPAVILALLILAFVGFTGTAYAVGQWARRRFGATSPSPVVDVVGGIVVLLLPLLFGRMLGMAGWPIAPFAMMFVVAGIGIEFLAWMGGFGAVLTNAFSHWQAKRAARTGAVVAP